MVYTQKKNIKMKKIILSLAVVFVMSSFTTSNVDVEKMNTEPITLEEVNAYQHNSSGISLVEDAKVSEEMPNVCIEIGAAVLSETSQGGYSFHESLTMSLNAMYACEALLSLGSML